jgi:hypothetical protein
MQISGHKTREVFERYSIINAGDLKDAVRKIAEHRQAVQAELKIEVAVATDKLRINKDENQPVSERPGQVQ